jgi:uncharacterized membrane protein HdeD (DUF308 family)
MPYTIASRWWMLLVRGIAAVLFGALTFIVPMASVFTLVILFGAYALVDGIFALVSAVRGARIGERWGALVFEGIAGIAAGVVTFLWPSISALALLFVIAFWAVITGVAEIVAAIKLREMIHGEWLLALTGALSIAFGVLIALYPSAGALAVALWIGAYALVFGILMIVLAFRLRSWASHAPSVPEPGLPVPA